MQLRELLITHSSRFIRTLLKRYILSEMSDVDITEAETAKEALEILQKKKFMAIIAGPDLIDMDVKKFYNEIKNFMIPFLLISDSAADKKEDELNKIGITEIIFAPFTAVDLKEKIDKLCNPRSMRVHRRLNIPGTKLIIHLQGEDLETSVINISEGGLLCEFQLKNEHFNLFKRMYTTIKFPESLDNTRIENLLCRALKFDVTGWDEDKFPKNIHSTLLFTNMTEEMTKKIDQVLLTAEAQLKSMDKSE